MSEYNCNAINHIALSDSFHRRLLAVPELSSTIPHRANQIPVRYLAVAASMVLAFAMSISAYFFFGNKPSPVVPAVVIKETTAATEKQEKTETQSATEKESEAPTQKPSNPSTQPPTQVSTDSEGNIIITTITDIITREIEDATEADTPQQPSPKTEQPTEIVKQPETEIESQTEEPISPTDPPYYPTPIENPPYCVEPADECDTFSVTVALDQLTGSGKVYCILFDETGNLLGDGDLICESRMATREWERDGYVQVSYTPKDYEIYVRQDYLYDVYFYNEDGMILNHSGTHT